MVNPAPQHFTAEQVSPCQDHPFTPYIYFTGHNLPWNTMAVCKLAYLKCLYVNWGKCVVDGYVEKTFLFFYATYRPKPAVPNGYTGTGSL